VRSLFLFYNNNNTHMELWKVKGEKNMTQYSPNIKYAESGIPEPVTIIIRLLLFYSKPFSCTSLIRFNLIII
jgi:hypothetical protein